MQFSTEVLFSVLGMLPAALFLLAALGVLGACVIAPVNEMVARSRKKIFFDKFAEQLTAMNLLAAVIAVIGLIAGFFMLSSGQEWFQLWLRKQQIELYVLLGGLAGLLIFTPVYRFTWKKMRKQKNTHIPLGLVTTATGLLTLVAGGMVALKMRTAYMVTAGATQAAVTALQSVYVPFMAFLITAALSSAGALSLVYLVLRRNKDDFGRDYYKFSLPLAARWSIIPTVLVLITQAWLIMTLPETAKAVVLTGNGLILWIVAMICTALSCGVWVPVSKSDSPLQFKGLIFLGTTLLWIAHALFLSIGFIILNTLK